MASGGRGVAVGSRGGTVLVAALAVDSVGNGLFMPLSLVYFLELTDVPLALLGVLLSVANAITLPVPVWAGAMADRIGALPLVVGAQVLQAVGYLAFAWVSGPTGIFVAAALVALGVRVFWCTIFTAVADYADGSSTARSTDFWYAVSNGARTAGLAAGGVVTGAVVAAGDDAAYRAVAYAAAGCFAAAAVLIAAFVRTPGVRHHEPLPRSGYATLVRDRPYLTLIVVNTGYALTSMMLALALPTVMLTGLAAPSWLTAAILAGNALLIAVLSAPVGKRLSGYRRTRTVVLAAALWTGWSTMLALLRPGELAWVIPVLVLATLLFTVAELLHAPASSALAAAVAPVQARGRYLATFQYSFAIASIVAPAFFATLYALDTSAPWLVLAALNAASIGAMLLLERRLPPATLRADLRAEAG